MLTLVEVVTAGDGGLQEAGRRKAAGDRSVRLVCVVLLLELMLLLLEVLLLLLLILLVLVRPVVVAL